MAFPDVAADSEKPKKKASLMGPLEASDDMTTDEDDSLDDSSAVAGEVLDAIKAGDAAGFATALKAFVLTCK